MAKVVRNAQQTKKNILENAKYLFSKKGYDATSIGEIAKASNINKAMLYYYFKNKIDIYEIVMEDVLSSIYKEIMVSDRCCDCATGDLKAFITIYAQFSSKHSYFPALLLRALSNHGKDLPDSVFTSCIKLFTLFSNILKRGEEDGMFEDIKPMIIYCMVIGSLNMYIITQPLRKMAINKSKDIDTCADCSIEEIADYIFKKVVLMLGVTS